MMRRGWLVHGVLLLFLAIAVGWTIASGVLAAPKEDTAPAESSHPPAASGDGRVCRGGEPVGAHRGDRRVWHPPGGPALASRHPVGTVGGDGEAG